MAPPNGPTDFRVERVDYEDGRAVLVFAGALRFAEASLVWADVRELLLDAPPTVRFDLSDVERIDGGCMALLVQLRCELESAGVDAAFEGARGQAAELYELYGGTGRPCLRAPPRRPGLLDQVGRVTLALAGELRAALDFVGALCLSLVRALRAPGSVRWRDLAPLMERAGADGLVIVVLINFLVGFIMGFQGADQLQRFGANVFVADLVGLSVTRELGPLMTAIIVCGRSGASFAAELGTMKVSEEVDALHSMGFDPIRFLVFPRVLALCLALPLLTLIADAVGVVGGLLVGITELQLTVVAYTNETLKALDLLDVFSGVVKSVVFAAAIGLIACQQGLAAEGGAVGVGQRTTSSVVSILFALILIDAGFTVAFYALGV
ncbi:MAG: MlaE family lipid ABC transporter permease subunit [Planctomycetota bacterium]|nr:MAG: MlaE family lipid ABC transporter permease subunit [Planctomycetota bacterium]